MRLLAVGGAGLYWEALARGLHELPRASAEIRARARAAARGGRARGAAPAPPGGRSGDGAAPGARRPPTREPGARGVRAHRPAAERLAAARSRGRVAVRDRWLLLTRSRGPVRAASRSAARACSSAGLLAEIRGPPRQRVSRRCAGAPHRRLSRVPAAPARRGSRSRIAAEQFRARSRASYAKRQETWLRDRVRDAVVRSGRAGYRTSQLWRDAGRRAGAPAGPAPRPRKPLDRPARPCATVSRTRIHLGERA